MSRTCWPPATRAPEMVELWSPEHKVVLERRLWLAVLRAQRELGVDVPDGVVEAYEAVVDQVDLASIEARERVTRHDVKARIEEFARPRRPRAHPQGHDVPRPHRERRAAPGPRRRSTWSATGWSPRSPAWPAWPPSTPTLVMVGPQPQRRRPGHHARQALRQRRPRSCCSRLERVERPAGPLPAAGHQGPGGHRSRTSSTCSAATRTSSTALEAAVARHLGFDARARPASARCTRGRSTSTSSPPWCRPAAGPSSLATTIRLMAGHELRHRGVRGRPGRLARPCPTR